MVSPKKITRNKRDSSKPTKRRDTSRSRSNPMGLVLLSNFLQGLDDQKIEALMADRKNSTEDFLVTSVALCLIWGVFQRLAAVYVKRASISRRDHQFRAKDVERIVRLLDRNVGKICERYIRVRLECEMQRTRRGENVPPSVADAQTEDQYPSPEKVAACVRTPQTDPKATARPALELPTESDSTWKAIGDPSNESWDTTVDRISVSKIDTIPYVPWQQMPRPPLWSR